MEPDFSTAEQLWALAESVSSTEEDGGVDLRRMKMESWCLSEDDLDSDHSSEASCEAEDNPYNLSHTAWRERYWAAKWDENPCLLPLIPVQSLSP